MTAHVAVSIAGTDELTDRARDHLRSDGDAVELPWELALLFVEIADYEDDPDNSRSELAPDWLTQEDVEVLIEGVAALALPPRTSLRLHVAADGVAGRPGYRLRHEWQTVKGRKLERMPNVVGGLVEFDGSPKRRLTLGQYRVLEAFDGLGPLGVDREKDLLATEQVRASIPAGDEGVTLAPILSRERVQRVERVEPRLVPVSNGWQLRPHIDGLSDAQVEDYYYRTRREGLGARVWPTRDDDGKRTRVVFTDRARAALTDARDRHDLSPRQLAEAFSKPEEFFGDNLDISALSERVVGFGPAVRRVIPSFEEVERGGWWDWDVGAHLEDVSGEAAPSSVSFKDPEVRQQVKQAIADAEEQGHRYIPDPTGPGLVEITPELKQAVETAEKLEEEQRKDGGQLKKKPKHVLLVQENIDSLVFDRSDLHLEAPKEALPPPPGLASHVRLLPHQNEGIAWLRAVADTRSESGARWRGCLLADDMGLGKTLQVLGFLAWRAAREEAERFLVVAPLALLENWRQEAWSFFGSLFDPILVTRGSELSGFGDGAPAFLARHRLVLVSYETLRRHELTFARVKWDTAALDEAQKAKNPASQIARVVRTLDARFRVAMTGTPVENSLKELWALYDWAAPGLLGSLRDFGNEYVRPLSRATTGPDTRRTLADKLHNAIEPVYARRLKSIELKSDLPPIEHRNHDAPLSADQDAKYSAALQNGEGRKAFATLSHLFAICAHPDMKGERTLRPLSRVTFAKGEQLIALLREIEAAGEKALVFANRRKIQKWLSEEIAVQFGLRSVPVINGQITESVARLARVEKFSAQPGFGVLVLAPKAAGLGLNITAANHVIHYTREWNPAIEKQATDRAYRIGQKRPVTVHTITAVSDRGTTVEQRLAALLDEKYALMNDFVVPMGGFDVSGDAILSMDGLVESQATAVAHNPAPKGIARLTKVAPVPAQPPTQVAAPSPDPLEPQDHHWLGKVPLGVCLVFEHLEKYGRITESEVASMLGGPRQQRRFARQFESYASRAPFGVRIESAGGEKSYVRDGSKS